MPALTGWLIFEERGEGHQKHQGREDYRWNSTDSWDVQVNLVKVQPGGGPGLQDLCMGFPLLEISFVLLGRVFNAFSSLSLLWLLFAAKARWRAESWVLPFFAFWSFISPCLTSCIIQYASLVMMNWLPSSIQFQLPTQITTPDKPWRSISVILQSWLRQAKVCPLWRQSQNSKRSLQ